MTEAVAMSATDRYKEELRLLQTDENELRALQERLDQAERLSRDEERTFQDLQSAIQHSRERLPTLEAAKKLEKVNIDADGLQEAWKVQVARKLAAYDRLADLERQKTVVTAEIKRIHNDEEALLHGVEDTEVQRYMLFTFWKDDNTVMQWIEQKIAAGVIGDGKALAGDDPGVHPLPARMIENVRSGALWVSRNHRG